MLTENGCTFGVSDGWTFGVSDGWTFGVSDRVERFTDTAITYTKSENCIDYPNRGEYGETKGRESDEI